MRLTPAQADRAAGVLLGQACGDALGVPYEFGRPPGVGEPAEMTGGGLGGFEPGEWSDDTAMAVAVAEGLADGGLDAVARRFLRWYDDGPADIGVQTREVLSRTRRSLGEDEPPADAMARKATAYALSHAHSAGNGALMRTAPVALFHLDDREGCAATARAVAELTHADALAGDSAVLWSEAIRIAVVEGVLDVDSGLDLLPASRRTQWAAWLTEAVEVPPSRFHRNGFTVTALQAAWSAIRNTPVPAGRYPCLHLQHALHAAVRIGHDTDTVAAIAGGLLGGWWGASAIPWRWRRAVHGWPGRDGRDLVALAATAARGGRDDAKGWASIADVPYSEACPAGVVPHPHDAGVLLGTHRSRDHGATAVVSLCRVGREQACFGDASVVVESRLLDSDDPAANPNLPFVLYDAADAVRGLRDEGHTVLLHCVAAQHRTPAVAVAYSVLHGHPPAEARSAIRDAVRTASGSGALWDAAGEVTEPE